MRDRTFIVRGQVISALGHYLRNTLQELVGKLLKNDELITGEEYYFKVTLDMESRLETLKTIYEIVQYEIKPLAINIQPNEIIYRSHFPWDNIMQHLDELNAENLITMKRSLMVVISITQKGMDAASLMLRVKLN